MEFLTKILQSALLNPAVQALILGFIFVGISWVVKKTKTKKDDRYWQSIKSAAMTAFNIAEKAIPDDIEADSALWKINRALKEFNNNVASRMGRSPSKTERDIAQDLWSEMAFELKKK